MWFDININGYRDDKFFDWHYWSLHWPKKLTLIFFLQLCVLKGCFQYNDAKSTDDTPYKPGQPGAEWSSDEIDIVREKVGKARFFLKTVAFIAGKSENQAAKKKFIRFFIDNLIANISLYAF